MNLTIYRDKWSGAPGMVAVPMCGTQPNGRVTYCCLGFLGLACGVDARYLSKDYPSLLYPDSRSKFPVNTWQYEHELAKINDSEMPQKQKELLITGYMIQLDVHVTFEDTEGDCELCIL